MHKHAGNSLAMKTNSQDDSDEDDNHPLSVRETGRCFDVVASKWKKTATTTAARFPCHDGLGGSIDGDRGSRRLFFASGSREISGIESAETAGNRAYYLCSTVRGIFRCRAADVAVVTSLVYE